MKVPFPVEKGWDGFYSQTAEVGSKSLLDEEEKDILKLGEEMSFDLFHKMSKLVPAYKLFLEDNKVDPSKIKSPADLCKVPWIDKDNYIKKYDLSQRCWNGELNAPTISASSGSSGQSTYWPRSERIEIETSYIYEFFLRNFFGIDKQKTLFICGFSMGIYIGGTFTLNCCMRLAQKGYPLTIVTPGIHEEEILRTFEQLASEYDQVILSGYPPFVRDYLEEGERRGIDWKKHKIKFMFASESFSENLREFIFDKVGIPKKDYYASSMNLYGTADAAIAGHENPLTILIRSVLEKDQELCAETFGKSYVPSINQYYPFYKHFEVENDEIIFSSANNGIPLLRYNIHDKGGLMTYAEQMKLLNEAGLDMPAVTKLIGQNNLFKLPAVYLFGRSDFTVTLYGLNIYPENVKAVLESKELTQFCSGRFVMETSNHEDDQSQYLLIHVELQTGVKASKELENKIKTLATKILRKKNSEYNHLSEMIGIKADPVIDLRSKGDEEYFPPTNKQAWVRKKSK